MANHETEPSIQSRLNERLKPKNPVVMYQRWEELLFLHWPMDPDFVQQQLPNGLCVDTHDGKAWIGVVPFQMLNVRPRFLAPLPWFSNFPELNLRTYVFDEQGRPGVWFFSLDTPQPFANWIARRLFNLNYRLARFKIVPDGRGLRYQSELRLSDVWDEPQSYNWTRVGEPFHAQPASLEFFLVERYRLFSYDASKQQLWSGQVHHLPYSIQRAELAKYSTRLFALNDITEPEGPPVSVLASTGVDVTVHPLTPA
ncbi:MAG: YqjF family protein [Opitutales bacterium]